MEQPYDSAPRIRWSALGLPNLPGALCKGNTTDLFFGPHVCDVECDGPEGCMAGKSETGRFARISAAKSMCSVCPVQAACADWAIETGQEFGIWGGMTERERMKARKDRRG